MPYSQADDFECDQELLSKKPAWEAAALLEDRFRLCAAEDLADEIHGEYEIPRDVATAIALSIICRRLEGSLSDLYRRIMTLEKEVEAGVPAY